MASKLVLIEYTKDVDSYANPAADEPTTIKSGTQRRVDAASAKSLTSSKRPGGAVAKLVGTADEKAEAREAVKAVEPPANSPSGH
jgi:hypothetical protein